MDELRKSTGMILRLQLVALALLVAGAAPAWMPLRISAGTVGEGRLAAPRVGVSARRSGVTDSVAYHVLPSSRFEVKTGKGGLFGFAGHSHLIRAHGFSGRVLYYPAAPADTRLEINLPAESLEVVTPPDTVEIRKVTETMRTKVLQSDQYPEITLVSKTVTPVPGGFHVIGLVTLVGQTREVPVEVAVEIGADTLRARGTFSVKQTDFGIKPYSGGPAGTVRVADRVTLDFDAVAVREDPDERPPS